MFLLLASSVIVFVVLFNYDHSLRRGADVNNLFDKVYMSGMRDFGRVQYSWGAPRSVSVNMRYQF